MSTTDYYTDAEWAEAIDDRPLESLSDERFMTLHRHWIWANASFRWFERKLAESSAGFDFTSDRTFSMYLWYSMLWSVIEGVQKHPVVIRGPFRKDLKLVREPLREARNSVMHVSDDAYYDERLFKIIQAPDSARAVRRVHKGFARLFLEELTARNAAGRSIDV